MAVNVDSSDLSESDSEVTALYGPKPLPGTGTGTLNAHQRELIRNETGCSAAVRKRDGWPCRQLTISGLDNPS